MVVRTVVVKNVLTELAVSIMKEVVMDIFTRIVLPCDDVTRLSTRKIVTLLRSRGIDPGQAFWVEIMADRIVIEQSRDAKPIPGDCQFRRIGSAA